ncbi:MAG: hypothetical protein OXN18_07155 [Gemmatimonadota bacterium]|nr:hypothetical protein [Gemmatimonadota bacterium]
MLGDFFSFYLTSLGEFWSSAIRIGLPQILLVILLICWLRRKGSGKSCSKSCCWIWSCGTGGSSWCCPEDEGCGCTCGACWCQTRKDDATEADADEE